MQRLLVQIKKMDNVKKWFYGLMIFGLLASLVSVLVTNGERLKSILIQDENNMFMDFFNSVYNNINGDPYATFSNYPPLVNFLYYAIGLLIPRESIGESGFIIRASQVGTLIYIL